MAAGREPGTGWPFLVTAGLSAPMGVAVVPEPLEQEPEQLLDLLKGRRERQAQRVQLPGRRPGWITYQRVSAASDGLAHVWHLAEDRQVVLIGHTGRVTACCFSPDETLVATSSWDRTARVWETSTGRQVAQFDQHEAWVSGVAFTPDGQRLITACWDGEVRAFDIGTGERTAGWTMSAPLVSGAAITADHRFISAGADHLVRITDLTRPGTSAAALLAGHTGEITTCVLSPDSELIVSGGRDRTLRVWDARTGAMLSSLVGHDDWVSGAAFGPDGNWFVSVGWDGRLFRWSRDGRGKQLASHDSMFASCTVLPRTGHVITTGHDGYLHVWHPATGALLQSTKMGDGVPAACVASPSSRYLAITSLDDGPEGRHAASDRAGRPIVMTEGVLYGGSEPGPLTDRDLAHLHAISVSGLGRYIAAEPYGGDITISTPITMPAWSSAV